MNKGLNELKGSIDKLIGERSDFKLIIAGEIDEGNPQSATVDWIYNSFNYPNVEWYGYIENVHTLFSSIDVVVLPSFYGEGVPHSLTEALAAGKPIITTDIPGCKEVFSDNGYLIEHQNSDALYEAMKDILENRQLLDKWSKNSRKHAEKFDIKKVNQNTIKLYG
jgi:glycosyltransferase involved in cell wall biosynthesis